jgi:hypothetical protein
MRLRRYLSMVAIWMLLGAATTARAQQVTQGNGVRLGEAFVLHLGLGAELAWDSNIFYAQPGTEINAFELRLTPRFDLTNKPRQGTRQIVFDLHGGLNYLEYLTGDQRIEPLRQFGVDAGVQAAFFPMNPYHFVVFDNYVRSTQPPYRNFQRNLDRDTNELGFRVNLSPGGGRLHLHFGYLFGIDYWESNELKPFDLMYHRFDLRAGWRFLPKTAVYIAASEILYLYQDVNKYHPNSYPLRVEAGLQGLITAKLTVNVWIGYGNGFYATVPTTPPITANPNSVIAGLSLNWKPTLLSSGTLGYNHDFVNALLGSYYDMDQVYISWTQLVWRFTGFIRFSYANERYQGIPPQASTGIPPQPVTPSTRTDNYFTLNARVDYPFKDWLFGSVGYDLQANSSNGVLFLGILPPAGTVPVDYVKHVVYLRLTLWY